MEKRLAWLDLAKLAAMFLVIYGHVSFTNEYVQMWVESFHVPAFFFISGIFIKRREKFGFGKNFYQLLVPTMLWFLILWLTYYAVITKMEHSGHFFENWFALFQGFWMGSTSGFGWFLIALFWIRLMLWRIVLLSRWHQLWVVAAVTALGVFLSCYPEFNRYHIVNALAALPYSYCGYLLAPHVLNLKMKHGHGVIVLLSLLVLTVVLSLVNGRVNSLNLVMGHYWGVSYLQGLLGAMLLLIGCNLLRNMKILNVGG